MDLHSLKKFNKKKNNRVGRGRSSGKGKTSGRGTKGQKSRTGHKKLPAFFEGGQMPLVQRLPKLRGFKQKKNTDQEIVNIEELNIFANGTKIDKRMLVGKGLMKNLNSKLKILGNGKLSKKIDLVADSFSKSALEQIKKAGGKVTVLPDISKKRIKKNKRSK